MVDWYFVGLLVYIVYLNIRIDRLENRIQIVSRRLLPYYTASIF